VLMPCCPYPGWCCLAAAAWPSHIPCFLST
jgi:hypothetical protein